MNDDSFLRTFGQARQSCKIANPDESKQAAPANINDKSSLKGGSKKGDSLHAPIAEEDET